MDWDDMKPKPPKTVAIGEDLSTLSVAELDARVAALEGEIQRVRAEATTKKARQAAADSLFKR